MLKVLLNTMLIYGYSYAYIGILLLYSTMEIQQFESMSALDSCAVIATIKSPAIARKVFRFFRGNNSKIVLQDVVLKEASRILQITKEDVIKKIGTILRKEVQVCITTDSMRTEATRYENQYGICHRPDSKILVAAKTFSWTLLTMDKKMIQTAEFEGILALNPTWMGGN